MSVTSDTALVLITRPEDQASDFKEQIEALGCRVLQAPMLKIRPVSYDTENLPSYNGLIFTSMNALRSFIPHAKDRTIPTICVGEHLAQCLKKAGFNVVVTAPTAELLIENANLNSLPVTSWLYVRGQNVSINLRTVLGARLGVDVYDLIVYLAEKNDTFSHETFTALNVHALDIVTFFSKRTAESFIEIIKRERLEGCLSSIKVLCIRETMVECVQPALWRGVYVSDQPTLESMLESLKRLINAQA